MIQILNAEHPESTMQDLTPEEIMLVSGGKIQDLQAAGSTLAGGGGGVTAGVATGLMAGVGAAAWGSSWGLVGVGAAFAAAPIAVVAMAGLALYAGYTGYQSLR
jgi:hypothetical protein